MLIDTLRQDLTAAMKARDKTTTRTIRSIITATTQAEVAGDHPKTLTDDEVIEIIFNLAKQRTEAAEAFDKGNRAEQAAAERAEHEVLHQYLPAALTPAELEALVEETLAERGWTSKADMGAAIRAINTEVAGRADGRDVADQVKRKLA